MLSPFDTVPIVRALQRALRAERNVVLAYLFGSTARAIRTGQAGHPKDLDIAVEFHPMPRRMQWLAQRTALVGRLEDAVAAFPSVPHTVDLVFLNTADPLLSQQVLKSGICLLSRGGIRRHRNFRVQTMTRYFDAQPMYEFFANRQLAAARRGHHG